MGPSISLASPVDNNSISFGANPGGSISLADPFEDELQKRMALAKQQGWSDDEIQRSALVERTMHQQQQAQQQQQTQAQSANQQQGSQPSFMKKLLVNGGALAADTLAGIGGIAAAPMTGGASLLGTAAVGTGVEALRQKLLGEKANVGQDLFSGALTALPGAGAAKDAIMGGKIATDVAGNALADTADQTANKFIPQNGKLVPTYRDTSVAESAAANREGRLVNPLNNSDVSAPQITGPAPNVASQDNGSLSQNILDMFKPGQKGAITSRLQNAGDDIRAGNRGIDAGMHPNNEPNLLTPQAADARNTFIDQNAKGSVRTQLAQISNLKQQAGQQLSDTIEAHNVPLAPNTTGELQQQALQNIKGVNGKGIPGFNATQNQPIIDSYNNLLSSATDLKGLNQFKQSLDNDVINYGRSSTAADPVREQIAQQYRDVVANKINELDSTGAITTANTQYSQAAQAQNALIKSGGISAQGVKVGSGVVDLGGNGIGGGKIQAAKDMVGRSLQNASNVLSTPAVKQAIGQYMSHSVGNSLTASPTATNNQIPVSGNGQLPADASQAMSGQASNTAGQNGTQLTGNNATDFSTIANAMYGSQVPTSQANTNGLQYSSTDLLNAAQRALMAGNDAAYKDLSGAATAAQAYEKANGIGASPTLNATQQKAVTSSQAAISLLGMYNNQIENYAQGASGNIATGTVDTLIGKYLPGAPQKDKNAAALQSGARDVAIQIATAISGGLKPQISTIEQVEGSLPSINDSPQLRQAKLSFLQSRLQDSMNIYATPVSQLVRGTTNGDLGSQLNDVLANNFTQ